MTEKRPDILVTGFGPFPHVRVNPTADLARRVAAILARSGFAAQALVLETSYSVGLPTLAAHLERARPRAVLMLGLAARARFVRVELFARGNASRLHPDVAGRMPGFALKRRSDQPLRTNGGPQEALAALRRNGVRTRLSPSAGRYLCDAGYAVALREADAPVLFIHVPPAPAPAGTRPRRPGRARAMSQATLAAALASVGRSLARRGRSF